ncbi:MAG: hypothetical protein AAGF95_06850 [Chloroflexota bacterium]
MSTLRVYISNQCPSCATAIHRVHFVRRSRPEQIVELVNLDDQDAMRPAYVFGTPTYCLGNQIIFLGNPSETELLSKLDQQVSTVEQNT